MGAAEATRSINSDLSQQPNQTIMPRGALKRFGAKFMYEDLRFRSESARNTANILHGGEARGRSVSASDHSGYNPEKHAVLLHKSCGNGSGAGGDRAHAQ